jgi:hypothetical protein
MRHASSPARWSGIERRAFDAHTQRVKVSPAVLVLVTLILVRVGVPAQAGTLDKPVLSGCGGRLLVRPARIDFCGDGSFYLTGLSWAAWGPSGAVAAALAHQNDCVPFCAAGHYHTYAVAVWLTRVRKCSDGRAQFTRLSYEFLARTPPHISSGPLVVMAPLGVGAARCP